MGKIYETLDAKLETWLKKQKMFFVATAPAETSGHINCSPKGIDTFRVLGPRSVAYLDFIGSGAETAAHLRQNGRIVVLFCAFDGAPKIIRLHGLGEVLERSGEDFEAVYGEFDEVRTARAIVRIDVTRISDSCGYGVPMYDYRGERDSMANWAGKKSDEELSEFCEENNRRSIDGLPAFDLDDA